MKTYPRLIRHAHSGSTWNIPHAGAKQEEIEYALRGKQPMSSLYDEEQIDRMMSKHPALWLEVPPATTTEFPNDVVLAPFMGKKDDTKPSDNVNVDWFSPIAMPETVPPGDESGDPIVQIPLLKEEFPVRFRARHKPSVILTFHSSGIYLEDPMGCLWSVDGCRRNEDIWVEMETVKPEQITAMVQEEVTRIAPGHDFKQQDPKAIEAISIAMGAEDTPKLGIPLGESKLNKAIDDALSEDGSPERTAAAVSLIEKRRAEGVKLDDFDTEEYNVGTLRSQRDEARRTIKEQEENLERAREAVEQLEERHRSAKLFEKELQAENDRLRAFELEVLVAYGKPRETEIARGIMAAVDKLNAGRKGTPYEKVRVPKHTAIDNGVSDE